MIKIGDICGSVINDMWAESFDGSTNLHVIGESLCSVFFTLNVDGTLVNSVDTFKQYYNELLTKDALGLAIYNYMMDNSVVSEIPQNLIDDQRDTYRKEIEASAENMGKTMDEYLETTDYDTEDALLDSYNDRIEESVKAYLIFQAVAEAEKIKVTDADVSDYFGDDSLSVQQAQKYYGEEYVNQTVLYNKVGDWLTAHATIV